MENSNPYPISVRQLSRLLKHYNLRDGDILALKHQSPNANSQAIDAIVKALTHLNLNVLVIVVDDFNDMDVLNEVEMNKRGWYKMKSLVKMMKLPEKDITQ